MDTPTIADPNPEFGHLADDWRLEAALKGLAARNIETTVVDSGAEARRIALDLIPLGAEVLTNLSETVRTIGLADDLNKSGRYDAIRPKLDTMNRETQGREMRKLAAAPEYTVGSVHAITEDGEVLTASGSGSQLGPYAYSATRVIWIAGTQKLVKDTADGMRRIEEYSSPLEDQRMMAIYGRPSRLARVLSFRWTLPGRVTLILVKERLGF